MTFFQKIEDNIEGVRYGKDEDGRWYPGAVDRVAQFLLGVEPDRYLSNGQICDVLQPTGCWDPPKYATLYIVEHRGAMQPPYLTELNPGDWVIKDHFGKFHRITHDSLMETYRIVETSDAG